MGVGPGKPTTDSGGKRTELTVAILQPISLHSQSEFLHETSLDELTAGGRECVCRGSSNIAGCLECGIGIDVINLSRATLGQQSQNGSCLKGSRTHFEAVTNAD